MMQIKLRLTVMNFLQFFVWGSWLISLGGYLIGTLKFSGGDVGAIYGTMGIASLFMPGLMGIVADRWLNAERVLGVCHILASVILLYASTVTDSDTMYWVMLLNAMFYMPTIALNNTVSYKILELSGLDIVKSFPPIRVWGTIGFIAAMWTIDFSDFTKSPMQMYVSAGAGILLGLYSFSMPACRPGSSGQKGILASLGLDALVLFRKGQMLVFFLFAMLLGAALQITNAFGGAFLDDFKTTHAGTFGVEHPNLLLSISQISETLFILTIPFFLRRFGIKWVMLISILAWVLRFGLFAIGDPGEGLWLLILSMIIYGMAFDFFNISGSLFVDKEADKSIRASAQGLFMIMTNGIGAWIGGLGSGWVVDHYTLNGLKDWPAIWTAFAVYALVIGVVFPFAFRYKHNPADVQNVSH
jgi:MFS transporter, NHS family, xanthosine permease